jgi:CRISPR-associated endoribonuclease Cas6
MTDWGKGLLSRLTLSIECAKNVRLSYDSASALQGVLMERIDSDTAAALHVQGFKPYSQYIRYEHGAYEWVVNTLTEKAARMVLDPLLAESFSDFHLDIKNADVAITGKRLETVSGKELSHLFYSEDSDRYVSIRFLSPVSFKSERRYLFYPQLRQIVRSLMSKYSAAFEDGVEPDEEMLCALLNKLEIVKYDLKSTYFHLEGIRIPSFIGEITLRVGGAQSLSNYLGLLAAFGEFSGIGIKTAMGMGALRLIKNEERTVDGRQKPE